MGIESLTKRERKALRKLEKQQEKDQKAQSRLVKKSILIFLFLAGIVGVMFLGMKWGGKSGELASIDKVSPSDWKYGVESAETILVEYSDFQCPACAYYHPIVQQLAEKYKEKLQFVYRHFPLKNIHKNAAPAAWAAEAAGKQGQFWEMQDKLFANQDEWANQKNPKDIFEQYAQSLGLDMEKFKSDFDSKEVRD
ncbi:MAG: thioredoxin domain-containing protein, partial [Parcubacteria group bacterium]|nr:thioredoxin domain-containing protein [Parcubacteria group bacterium]